MKRFEIQFKPEEERPMQVIIADRIVQGKGGLWDFYDDNDDPAGSVEVARFTLSRSELVVELGEVRGEGHVLQRPAVEPRVEASERAVGVGRSTSSAAGLRRCPPDPTDGRARTSAPPRDRGRRAVRPREFRVSRSRRASRNEVPQVERKGAAWRCSNARAHLGRTPRGGSPGVRPGRVGVGPTIRRERPRRLEFHGPTSDHDSAPSVGL